MLLIPRALALAVFVIFPAGAQVLPGGVRVTFDFANTPGAACEIELTRDSVHVKRDDPFAVRPAAPNRAFNPPTDSLEIGRRALTAEERDSAGMFMSFAQRWKGYKRYACAADEGYGFSLWTDSLLLNCDNCFSCSAGLGMGEARMLEKFGRLTLWLYRMKDGWRK